MLTVRLSSGAEFKSEAGSTILDSAARFNIALPYSCKTGRCGACKSKVLTGSTHAIHREIALSEEEKAQGWILSCVREADSDLFVEIDDLGGVNLPAIKTLPCRVSRLERLADDVMRVTLRLPPSAVFCFIPGQYVDVIGPNSIRRSYSLANSNFVGGTLELHVRRLAGGKMSDYWFNQAEPNDLLRLNGPLGTFFLRGIAGLDLIFLATGTGIAPVKSMLESLSQRQIAQRPKSVTVLWGGRHTRDIYFNLSETPGDFSFIPVLSRAASDWSGARGYVQEVLLNLSRDLSKASVYACGSDSMIRDAKSLLLKAGLPARRFYFDAFVRSGID
jgi:CDP-4-dehydro-6-deoxyglucose reductase